MFRDAPFNLDVSGGFATPVAAELIKDADLLVGWGCALNMWTLRHGTLVGDNTTVVQVDLDTGALGAHQRIDLGVTGDTAATARAVHEELDRRAGGSAAAGGVAAGLPLRRSRRPPRPRGPLARRAL